MSKVAILDTKKRILEPCHPAVAGRLLDEKKAAIYKRFPFTIILKREVPEPQIGDYRLSIDPGSKCTGMAITDSNHVIVALFELHHRGHAIKQALTSRSGHRRSRRTRNCRHRPPRFDNRGRKSPRLIDGQWVYEKVPNTKGAENTYHRVSNAMLKDKRYEWIKLNPMPASHREKTRLYYANGKRMRHGDIYFEKEGLFYRFNSNKEAHRTYKKQYPKKVFTYKVKSPSVKKRWRRVLKEEHRNAKGHKKHDTNQLEFDFMQGTSYGTTLDDDRNGWVAPSLMSRVYNIDTWVNRLCKVYPITRLAVEHVKFDTQFMENPEIKGEAYQHGTLEGYEEWQFLLERDGYKCFYCGAKENLTKDHVIPTSRGGSDRPDNKVVACRKCNSDKTNLLPHEIEDATLRNGVKKALKHVKKPLKDAAAVNILRWKIVETLKAKGFPVFLGTGGRTKWHRKQAELPKTHYYDAACVAGVAKLPRNMPLTLLEIHAVGYGHRQDLGPYKQDRKAQGFKKPYQRVEHAGGFQKQDMVKMTARRKKQKGKPLFEYTAVGSLNCFETTKRGPQKMRVKHNWDVKDGRLSGNITQLCKIQKRDGYAYKIATCIPTAPDSRQKVKNPLIS